MSSAAEGDRLKGYLFAGSSILLATLAQLVMKLGVSRLPTFSPEWWSLDLWLSHMTAPALIALGFAAYFLSMLTWLGALAKMPLNKAYPLISISYALVYLASVFLPWFNEAFSLYKFLGVLLICAGVVMVVSGPASSNPLMSSEDN